MIPLYCGISNNKLIVSKGRIVVELPENEDTIKQV